MDSKRISNHFCRFSRPLWRENPDPDSVALIRSDFRRDCGVCEKNSSLRWTEKPIRPGSGEFRAEGNKWFEVGLVRRRDRSVQTDRDSSNLAIGQGARTSARLIE